MVRATLSIAVWSIGVAGVFYRLQLDPPAPTGPCNDVFIRSVPVCAAESPIDVGWSYIAIAVAVWAAGIVAGFAVQRLSAHRAYD